MSISDLRNHPYYGIANAYFAAAVSAANAKRLADLHQNSIAEATATLLSVTPTTSPSTEDLENFAVLMSSGYIDQYNTQSLGDGLGGKELENLLTIEKTRKINHPSVAAIAAIPGIPPTPAQVNRYLNRDWNTWARSVDKLELGSSCRFSVSAGTTGAFMGIGGEGLEGSRLSQFSHALTCDLDGVHIVENGIKIFTLKALQKSTSLIRIHRQEKNIIYVVTTATETIVKVSSIEYPTFKDAYIYGMLYSSGDKITSTEFLSGEVLFGRA
jgi:hypothetical protein